MNEPQGVKFDADKPRLDLLPVRPLIEAAEIKTFGAKKYGDRNWEKGLKYGRLYRALLGHLFSFWLRQDLDEESGKSHLAHALCCLLMLMEMRHIHPECDDRPTYSST